MNSLSGAWIVLNLLHIFHPILALIPKGRGYYPLYFDEEAEALRGHIAKVDRTEIQAQV